MSSAVPWALAAGFGVMAAVVGYLALKLRRERKNNAQLRADTAGWLLIQTLRDGSSDVDRRHRKIVDSIAGDTDDAAERVMRYWDRYSAGTGPASLADTGED